MSADQGLAIILEKPRREDLRSAFARLPAGVVIVTTATSCGDLAGAAVSSFTSLSLDPPLVSLGLAQNSRTLAALLASGRFAVHLVTEAEQAVAMRFAANRRDKFSDVAWALSPAGVPTLTQFKTRMECALESAQTAGDHRLVIGRVIDLTLADETAAPVAWFQRGFRVCERLVTG